MLSLDAQGLWIRMLCWMSENEIHRGFLELPSGEPMTIDDIAAKAGKPRRQVRRIIEALRRIGIHSEDERGCIFSRRMVRDVHISVIRKQAAMKRVSAVERAKDGKFAPPNSREVRQQTSQQKPTVTASASASALLTAAAPGTGPGTDRNGTSKTPPPELQEWVKETIAHYPGSEALPGYGPDEAIVQQCIEIAEQKSSTTGKTVQETISRALEAMHRAHKTPGQSWAWFPKVLAHYLQPRKNT